MSGVLIHTIGFTKKSAKDFFEKMIAVRVKRIVDVRLNNTSQLAGFAKKDDLIYFLRRLGGIEYVHLPDLAPTQPMLDDYKKHGGDWERYERQFMNLIAERQIEKTIPREVLDGGCLLCSEDKPHHCHRRLVANYLRDHWGDVEVNHIA